MRYAYPPILALVSALLAMPAVADDADGRFNASAIYLFNAAAEADGTDTDFQGDNGQAVYLGYKILPMLSLEVGGVWFDPIDGRRRTDAQTLNTEHEVTGYTYGLRGRTDFAGLFDVWAGIGLYSWESRFNYRIQFPAFPGLTRTGTNGNSGRDIYYRVGVSLPLAGNFKVTLESAHFELSDFFSNVGDDVENTDFDHRYVGLGIEYNF